MNELTLPRPAAEVWAENGPVPPSQLNDAIRMSNQRNVTMTIFDSGGAGLTWPAEETE